MGDCSCPSGLVLQVVNLLLFVYFYYLSKHYLQIIIDVFIIIYLLCIYLLLFIYYYVFITIYLWLLIH